MGVPIGIVIDCANPARVGEFWRDALDYEDRPPPAPYESWDAYDAAHGMAPEESGCMIQDPDGVGPTLFFQLVPEGKVVKNRVHVDIKISRGAGPSIDAQIARIEAGVDPLVARGATLVRRNADPEDYFIVLQDPEGNEFCLV